MPPLQRMGPRGRGKKRASFWRHLRAPAGVAAPRSRSLVGGEDCLSEASSAALTFGTGAKAPEGPRPGETLSPSVIPASLSPTLVIGDPVYLCPGSFSLLLSVIPASF